uniref:BZIP domain-containing protein n=2 Tax=Skeletonema marinoi TaxID=267567 RepID=A0A7S2PRM4_9STRA
MKRKATTTDAAVTAAAAAAAKKKKPSPLLGKPQKFYAPSTAPDGMTREELSVWRKEERRKRNRASAAASRIKTQSKIAELEGQVSHWKSKCEDMEDMMMKLQRQVDLLTRAQSPTAFEDASMAQQQQQHHYLVSPPSSHPNSPSSTSSLSSPLALPSIVTSSLDVKNFLAPPNLMLSPPSDDQTRTVENKADITSSHVNDSKKHLNMISRQA